MSTPHPPVLPLACPKVRKEISAVEWFRHDALPKGCYGVEPFLPRLHRWMAKTKGLRAPKSATAGENLITTTTGICSNHPLFSFLASLVGVGVRQTVNFYGNFVGPTSGFHALRLVGVVAWGMGVRRQRGCVLPRATAGGKKSDDHAYCRWGKK